MRVLLVRATASADKGDFSEGCSEPPKEQHLMSYIIACWHSPKAERLRMQMLDRKQLRIYPRNTGILGRITIARERETVAFQLL